MPLPWCRNFTAEMQLFWSKMGYFPPLLPVFLRAFDVTVPFLVRIPLLFVATALLASQNGDRLL